MGQPRSLSHHVLCDPLSRSHGRRGIAGGFGDGGRPLASHFADLAVGRPDYGGLRDCGFSESSGTDATDQGGPSS